MACWDKSQRADSVLTPALRAKLENGPLVPDDFTTNGCTFIPDDLFFFRDCSKTPACVVHDYDYHLGGTWHDFREANLRLRRNLVALGVPRWDAWVVYVGVRMVGAPHFNFHEGQASYTVNTWLLSEGLAHSRDIDWKKIAKAVWAVPAFRTRILAVVGVTGTAVLAALGYA